MSIDYKKLQISLAEHNVYNAWQYVSSLCETMEYLSISFNLIQKVYNHRTAELETIEEEILRSDISNPGTPSVLTTEHIKRTNLDIVGYEIQDGVFLRKTMIEFIHYARVCMDLLLQIANAALLGDEAIDIEDRALAKKVFQELAADTHFTNLKSMFDGILNDLEYQYLVACDNYLKHIKTILISIKSSIIVGNHNEFVLESFVYNGNKYPKKDAIDEAKAIYQMVENRIDSVLTEVLNQIPNGKSTNSRIQTLQFEQFAKKSPDSCVVESITFFITVENDLSELPQEIAVYPLIIKPNREIFSFDFRLEEIFIRRMRDDNTFEIIGCAKLKNGLDTNEFYRKYVVSACDYTEYAHYLINFTQKYQQVSLNYYAVSGKIVIG